MSDEIKHECGIALIRLLKPLDYYQKKYGTALYGINKLNLLLQKQRNRGQDGAGLATIKLNPLPGTRFISRKRSNSQNYLDDLFQGVYEHFNQLQPSQKSNAQWLKDHMPYTGEVLLGHLRYGTHGLNTIETCHPFLRQNNWISRNLVMAGNFNMTNNDELFDELIELGQFPKERSDTVTMMEKVGHFLDSQVQKIFQKYKDQGSNNIEITNKINQELNVVDIISKAFKKVDGGYVMIGIIGNGDSFVARDPNGIRPVFYYKDEEVIVVASERPAIQTAFKVRFKNVHEIPPGHVLVAKADGKLIIEPFIKSEAFLPCSFENIYFSRGNDKKIYLIRKALGKNLFNEVLKKVDRQLEHTVFSYIPNTAETAFFGLVEAAEEHLIKLKTDQILKLGKELTFDKLNTIMKSRVRTEKLVVKDAKIRTFIADNASRSDLISHVYDVTYGIVENFVDTIVLLDDSIVRGSTLKNSVLSIVATLHPKRIIIVSSAPQIRYPDCYGIDMSVMNSFLAFQAILKLIEEHEKSDILDDIYQECLDNLMLPKEEMSNPIIKLYDLFTLEQINLKIIELVRPEGIDVEIDIVFQTIEGLKASCDGPVGDWYFSGNYPTPGGMKVVNKAFINFYENNDLRPY